MANQARPENEPVVQPDTGGDVGPGGVTRQTGPDALTIHRADPLANAPVIQVDPEITVTRQAGIFVQDAGQGVYRMDDHITPEQAQQTLGSDRPVRTDEPQVSPGLPASQAQQVHAYGPVTQTTEAGEKRGGEDPEFAPPSDVFHTDRHLPPDHATGVVSQDLPDVVLPEDQLAAYKQDKAFPADRQMSADEAAVQQEQMREAINASTLGSPTGATEEAETDKVKKRGKASKVEVREEAIPPGEAKGEQAATARVTEEE